MKARRRIKRKRQRKPTGRRWLIILRECKRIGARRPRDVSLNPSGPSDEEVAEALYNGTPMITDPDIRQSAIVKAFTWWRDGGRKAPISWVVNKAKAFSQSGYIYTGHGAKEGPQQGVDVLSPLVAKKGVQISYLDEALEPGGEKGDALHDRIAGPAPLPSLEVMRKMDIDALQRELRKAPTGERDLRYLDYLMRGPKKVVGEKGEYWEFPHHYRTQATQRIRRAIERTGAFRNPRRRKVRRLKLFRRNHSVSRALHRRPPIYLAINRRTRVDVVRISLSKIKRMGSFNQKRLRAWAARNKITKIGTKIGHL